MPEKKISKEEAEYGPGVWHRKCSQCTMWVAPDACTLVEGEIEPTGWCKYFKRKKGGE